MEIENKCWSAILFSSCKERNTAGFGFFMNSQTLCPAIPDSQLKKRESWQLCITLGLLLLCAFWYGTFTLHCTCRSIQRFSVPAAVIGEIWAQLPGLSLFWPGDGDRGWSCWAAPEQCSKNPKDQPNKKQIKKGKKRQVDLSNKHKISAGLCHSSAPLAVWKSSTASAQWASQGTWDKLKELKEIWGEAGFFLQLWLPGLGWGRGALQDQPPWPQLCLPAVGTDESQESSMTDADDTQLHAVESDEF